MKHRDCGGEIVEDPSKTYPYDAHEDGHVEQIPAYRCAKCGEEILGDAMIVLYGRGEPITDERKEKLMRVIDTLRGSAESLESELEDEGLDYDELKKEDLELIDSHIFLCEQCNWWCGDDERSGDRDEICTDCG